MRRLIVILYLKWIVLKIFYGFLRISLWADMMGFLGGFLIILIIKNTRKYL
ncbi:hypothetical protein [Acinetobacter sp. Z1]|uniref:hypothetical protein n=1 Tax=Acinetobacter sp. Z1 TaxID=2953738 RepID=UPI0034A5BDED